MALVADWVGSGNMVHSRQTYKLHLAGFEIPLGPVIFSAFPNRRLLSVPASHGSSGCQQCGNDRHGGSRVPHRFRRPELGGTKDQSVETGFTDEAAGFPVRQGSPPGRKMTRWTASPRRWNTCSSPCRGRGSLIGWRRAWPSRKQRTPKDGTWQSSLTGSNS